MPRLHGSGEATETQGTATRTYGTSVQFRPSTIGSPFARHTHEVRDPQRLLLRRLRPMHACDATPLIQKQHRHVAGEYVVRPALPPPGLREQTHRACERDGTHYRRGAPMQTDAARTRVPGSSVMSGGGGGGVTTQATGSGRGKICDGAVPRVCVRYESILLFAAATAARAGRRGGSASVTPSPELTELGICMHRTGWLSGLYTVHGAERQAATSTGALRRAPAAERQEYNWPQISRASRTSCTVVTGDCGNTQPARCCRGKY